MNKNTDISFNLKKNDWQNQLDKHLQINDDFFKEDIGYVRNIIIQKIELLK